MSGPSITLSPASTAGKMPAALTTRADITQSQVVLAAAFIACHVVLAIVMRAVPGLATAHALLCLVVGVGYALTTRKIRNVAMIVAYLAGCEVLWRMNHADVFWELGKYSVIAVLVTTLIRIDAWRNRLLAIAYLGLLLPSVVLTFFTLPPDVARQQVAFNMTGPVAIALAVMVFSNLRLTTNQRWATALAFIGPAAGLGALSFLSTSASSELAFENGSNMITSGGFGPNQVAAVLGLAVMFLFLISFERRLAWRIRGAALALAAMLAVQSALTFARGGIGLALAGTCGAMFVLMRGSRRARMTVAIVGLLSLALGKYVIEPRLEDMTKGKLSERYSSTTSSGRDVYAGSELMMFKDNPLLGVGPGVGLSVRDESGIGGVASHTEYTRMLAEHGVFGLVSLLCLLALGARAIRQSRETTGRAFTVAMLIWVALFLLIYGTRLVAPAFVFGFAFATHSAVARTASPPRTLLRA